MKLRFNSDRDRQLRAQRKIGFDEMATSIMKGRVLAVEKHHNQEKYPNQNIFYIPIDDEIYSVPFVIEDDGTIFLKTIFANRKARKKFLGK